MFRVLSTLAIFLFAFSPLRAATLQFGPRQDVQTGFQRLTGLALADFNGDGYPDIAVTDIYANEVVVYLNDGHGSFSKPLVMTLTTSGYAGLGELVSGDINEDGKQDLIVGPVGGTQYDIVLLGNGDGTFTQGKVLTSTSGFINAQLLDLNGDKHLDLVSGSNPAISVELGDGKGNFTDSPVPTDTIGFNVGLAVADFNGDGRFDLLTSAYNTLQLQYFSGKGDGSFTSPLDYTANFVGTYGSELTPADFNGDGKQDFLARQGDLVVLAFGNGDGTFQLDPAQIVVPNLPYQISTGPISPTINFITAVGDMDANGSPDIVGADDYTSLLSVLLNDGTGKFPISTLSFEAPIDPGNNHIQLADLNGDGLPDIVVTNYKTQNISIFLSILPKATPTVTLSSSASQVLVGGSANVTVQVKSGSSHTPTGTVTLTSGTTSLGQQAVDTSGQANFTVSNLAVGQHPITANYAGDAYNNSASNGTSLSVAVTDYQVALTYGSQSVAVGGTATYNLALTPEAGFSGTVSLSCSGLPAAYICPATTATVSGQALTIPFSVTPAPTMTLASPASRPARRPGPVLAGLGLAGLLLGFRKRRRVGMFAVVPLFLLTLAGCGKANTPSTPPYTGTSNFTILLTASQGAVTVSHQVTATLTVHS